MIKGLTLGLLLGAAIFFTGEFERVYDNWWCDRNKVECVMTQPEIAFGLKEYHNLIELHEENF